MTIPNPIWATPRVTSAHDEATPSKLLVNWINAGAGGVMVAFRAGRGGRAKVTGPVFTETRLALKAV